MQKFETSYYIVEGLISDSFGNRCFNFKFTSESYPSREAIVGELRKEKAGLRGRTVSISLFKEVCEEQYDKW